MTTTKTITDARVTIKKAQIGVTYITATGSRRTKHKLSFDHNFAHLVDPPGFYSDTTGLRKGNRTRRTITAR